MLAVNPIPALVGGTVAVADRKVFNQSGGGITRIQQVGVKVTGAGTHANLVATIEGSFDGATWYSLAISPLNPKLPAAIVLSDLGVAFPLAYGLAGFVLTFETAFTQVRLGLAGDGAGGSGRVEHRSVRV